MGGDDTLIQIVDAALAEAVRKAGPWLACRPGCNQCCIGPFPITPLDAVRLREGLFELEAREPERASRVRERTREWVARMEREYPGNTLKRLLEEDEAGMEEACPALDPETGTCDLYSARPITCRTFGPPVRFAGKGLAICELCFDGATDQEIAACEVDVDPENLEGRLLAAMDEREDTTVAYALLEAPDRKPIENTPVHFPAST
jgi:Fe-S-cluster containining protein